MVPSDLAATLIAYGVEQAFVWTGVEPRNMAEFWFECGRTIQTMKMTAWEKARVDRDPRT
jgi:hypothetical protein